MKLIQAQSIICLWALFSHSVLSAEQGSGVGSYQSHSHLSQWFGVDPALSREITVLPRTRDSIGERSEVTFKSDDGQHVNGMINYPKTEHGTPKLALLLHPMGADQRFWWTDTSPLAGNKISEKLRSLGYTIISLDARKHGQRSVDGFGPRELLQHARSKEPRVYTEMIIGTVRDYRAILRWAQRELKPSETLVLGYSMGAQMSLLLAGFEPSVGSVVVMVPPYVGNFESPVAPRVHAHRIDAANVLWLAGREDPYSSIEQTKETFDALGTKRKRLVWFDSGHRLPNDYLSAVLSFLDSINKEAKQ